MEHYRYIKFYIITQTEYCTRGSIDEVQFLVHNLYTLAFFWTHLFSLAGGLRDRLRSFFYEVFRDGRLLDVGKDG